MKRFAATVAVLLALAGQAAAAEAVVLRYRDANRWVASADNAPLRKLMKAARNGSRTFIFRLPTANRDIQEERVEILRGLLQREAEKSKLKKGVMLEEADGPAPTANTIWIQAIN